MNRYKNAVSCRLIELLSHGVPFALRADPETAAQFISPAIALADGGKRTRALFSLAGWQAAHNFSADALDALPTSELPVDLGVALELYQLSALIHDDIIDSAPTRRGVPTSHEAFAALHTAHRLTGDPSTYGTKMAILLGDYVLSLASHTLARTAPANISVLFEEMAAEVAFGQYTDVHAEYTPLHTEDTSNAITSALTVLHHKAARYSVTVPTLLGATLAHATPTILNELEFLCSPLGEAFQLRDDELGVFGTPAVTGKPAGGDITEGKRTVLLALTRIRANESEKTALDAFVGQELTAAQLKQVRHIIRRSGAYEEHERMIQTREKSVSRGLASSSLHLDVFAELAGALAQRQA